MVEDLDNIWNTYNAIKDWLIFSDTKAGAIIAFYAIFGSTFLPKFIEIKNTIFPSLTFSILWILTISLSSISIIFALLCLYPSKRISCSNSIFFYRDIAENFPTASKYSFQWQKLYYQDDSSLKDISEQVWVLSKIATKKYDFVSYSIKYLIFSIIPFSILLILIMISP